MLTDAERRAARKAEAQLGLVTFADLLEAGMSRATISRRVESGDLTRRRPGVYSFAGTPRMDTQRIAEEVLSVGATAAASHDTAAFLWGLIPQEPDVIHVVVRRWRREHRVAARVHESLDFIPRDRVLKDGVPITVPSRTIVDLGATSKWKVEAALSRGIRAGLFTIEEVAAFVDRVARRGRRGVGVIRPLIDYHRVAGGRTESPLEDLFLRLLVEREIELPECQYLVHDRNGSIVCRADFAYPKQRLIIELDGREYHSDSDGFQSDRDKQNRTQALGWTTLRFTWFDLTSRRDHTISTVVRTLRLLA